MSFAEWYHDWDNLWNDVDDQAEPTPPPLPRHPRVRRLAGILGATLALVLVLAAGLGFSFWVAASRLLAAIDRRDTIYLVQHVDWPVLRHRLDIQMVELDRLQRPISPRSGGTIEEASFLSGVSEHIVGRLTQPAGLVDMLRTRLFHGSSVRDQGRSSLYDHIQGVTLTSLGVVLNLASEDGETSGVSLCFAVRGIGLPGWELTGIGFAELGGGCRR